MTKCRNKNWLGKCVIKRKSSATKHSIITNYLNLILTFIGIIAVIGVIYYGGTHGWFQFAINVDSPINLGDIDFGKLFLQQPTQPSASCTFNFDKSVAFVGESVTGTIRDGELKRCIVGYNYENTGWKIYNVENLDINGIVSATASTETSGTYSWVALCGHFEGANFIVECRTNTANIEILPLVGDDLPPPPDEGLEPGDVVGSGGGSATLGDGEQSIFEINLVPTDEEFDMCAEIERKSNKVDPNCNPTGDLEDWAEFTFLDSFGVVWQKTDQIFAGMPGGPNSFGNPDVVSVAWDGTKPFKGFMIHDGSCDMNMEMRVTLVVC